MSKFNEIIAGWYEVPASVTIPDGYEFALVTNMGIATYYPAGYRTVLREGHASGARRLTPEPPAPRPTEVGIYLDDDGYVWRRTQSGWVPLTAGGVVPEDEAPLKLSLLRPCTPRPKGAVLSENDKRPVVDRDGDRWCWDGKIERWVASGWPSLHYATKAKIDAGYGPLDYADEEADDE